MVTHIVIKQKDGTSAERKGTESNNQFSAQPVSSVNQLSCWPQYKHQVVFDTVNLLGLPLVDEYLGTCISEMNIPSNNSTVNIMYILVLSICCTCIW
jgi:hypothetical protein